MLLQPTGSRVFRQVRARPPGWGESGCQFVHPSLWQPSGPLSQLCSLRSWPPRPVQVSACAGARLGRQATEHVLPLQVDCTKEVELCREHLITGFPSIRVFRKGHDEISTPFGREHEAYRGDRTEESLLAFADTLAPTAGQPHYYIRGVNRVAKSTGCALSGFVLVKKVSGSLD